MSTFLWTYIILSAINIVLSLVYLGRGEVPPRTSGGMALSVVVSGAFVAWALHLLMQQ